MKKNLITFITGLHKPEGGGASVAGRFTTKKRKNFIIL
jgi:hypothetical protein